MRKILFIIGLTLLLPATSLASINYNREDTNFSPVSISVSFDDESDLLCSGFDDLWGVYACRVIGGQTCFDDSNLLYASSRVPISNQSNVFELNLPAGDYNLVGIYCDDVASDQGDDLETNWPNILFSIISPAGLIIPPDISNSFLNRLSDQLADPGFLAILAVFLAIPAVFYLAKGIIGFFTKD